MVLAMSTADLVEKASERAQRDPEFAAALTLLVEAKARPRGEMATITAARVLNEVRVKGLLAEFKANALTTAQVQELLGLGTPQAVHRLRSRGKLLGMAIGNATYFPAWQFADGALRPDLPRIIGLIAEFTTDALEVDRIMRLVHGELGGQCIADALNDAEHPEHCDAAWNILGSLGF